MNGLVGGTHGLLLRREDQAVSAVLCAGTGWPGPGLTSPSDLARQLLASAKNGSEHAYAIRSLAQALELFCSYLQMPAEPSELLLPHVTHLATRVRGRPKTATSLLDLVARVHPTAAMAGTPKTAGYG